LVISSISTSFGHLHAHHQEIRLRSTAYSFLSCCSCCDAGDSGSQMCALCGECCLSGNIAFQATFSTQRTHLATRLSIITTATTGQETIGSGTQSNLLMMGIKMPETCWDTIDYQNHYLLHLVGLTFTYPTYSCYIPTLSAQDGFGILHFVQYLHC